MTVELTGDEARVIFWARRMRNYTLSPLAIEVAKRLELRGLVQVESIEPDHELDGEVMTYTATQAGLDALAEYRLANQGADSVKNGTARSRP